MKRSFYAILLAGATFIGFSSCNNGMYDADVNTTNSGGNPLNPGGGGGGTGGGNTVTPATLGRIKAKVDGKLYDISGAYTSLSSAAIFSGSDLIIADAKFYHLGVVVDNYAGPGTYPIDGVTGTNNGNFGYINATTQVSDSWTTDDMTTGGTGGGTITVTEESGTEIKGTFNFTAYREEPAPSATEKIVVTDGSFYLTK